MKSFRIVFLFMLPAVLLLNTCSDDDDPVTPTISNPTITVGGVLDIKPGEVIPENAKLTVLWSVDAAGDYAYIYGTGSVDISAGTFTITLEEPPESALNVSPDGYPSFGIGYVVLGDFVSTEPHKLAQNEPEHMYGAVSNIGVIYMKGDAAEWASHAELNWLATFTSGYDMGEGMTTSGLHDKFVPTSADSFVLTVSSDANDFSFPDWK